MELHQRVEELDEQHDVQFEYTARLNSFIISVESNCKATMGRTMHCVDYRAEEADRLELKVGDLHVKLHQQQLDYEDRFKQLESVVQQLLSERAAQQPLPSQQEIEEEKEHWRVVYTEQESCNVIHEARIMHIEAFINDNDVKPKILAIEIALEAQSHWNSVVDVHVGGVVRPMGEPSKDGASINTALSDLKAEVSSINTKVNRVYGGIGLRTEEAAAETQGRMECIELQVEPLVSHVEEFIVRQQAPYQTASKWWYRPSSRVSTIVWSEHAGL